MGEEAGLEGDALTAVQQNAYHRLDQMIRYCQTPDCLRKYILEYFGEKAPDHCGFCLNCINPPKMEDVTAQANAVLRCVDQTGERFGKAMVVDILRGAENERITAQRLDTLLSYGALSQSSREHIYALVDRLQEMNALRIDVIETPSGQFPILKLGDRADEILSGDLNVTMLSHAQKKNASRKKAEPVPMNVDRDLLARLTALRKKISVTRSIPPYIILSDNVLRALADQKPQTLDEMRKVPGIGVVKLREYGSIFLKEIQKYLDETNG